MKLEGVLGNLGFAFIFSIECDDLRSVSLLLFNFTFALNLHLEPKHNQTMKRVMPSTESEARRYLKAKEYVGDNFVVLGEN